MSEILELSEIIEGLHRKWTPHEGQLPFGSALFYQGYKNIFGECGRNLGKTDIASYCTWRWAMQYPGSENYIFEPFQNQAREILWASNRIQTFGPEEWIQDINKTEMRITFNNGSFVKLDGADNEDARRGIKPKGLIIYDEFKDHKKSFVDAMEPNRASHDAPALFLGTPPEFHNHFVDFAEYAKANPLEWKYIQAPSSLNPHLSRKWLENKKKMMIAMGDEEGWLREYEATFVKGGKRHIFPQFLKYSLKPLQDLLPKDINHWQMCITFDPGTSTTFAVLFTLYNPYSKKIIIVDEIYEQTMSEMTVQKIYGKAQKKVDIWKRMGVKEFQFVYDEAATWFKNEISELCSWYMEPSKKAQNDKNSGISLIRDMFANNSIDVAKECLKYIWEMENYIKDDEGRIPKINDHLIDCHRYTLAALGYEFTDTKYIAPPDPDTQRRAYRIEDDFNDPYTEI